MVVIMTAVARRVNQYGIEVSDSVTWQGWEPGGEYTKQITLKNVQVKTKKLKYRVPNTRFFTTKFPKPIVLSSGTSYTLPVTFRPLEKGEYQDEIKFETNDGDFAIPMRAVLPKEDLAVPEALVFGMCAVKDVVELTFDLVNTSELLTSFNWEISEPFSLVPNSGTLAPRTSCKITASFSPKSALVYEGKAVCKYGPAEKRAAKGVNLEGIGKFPHLLVSGPSQSKSSEAKSQQTSHEVTVDFGDVPIGNTVEKYIELHNLSPVNAPFQVMQPSAGNSIDGVFSCSQFHGVVAPQSTARIKVSFSPQLQNVTSVDYFEVIALGATNCSIVRCVGKGKRFCVDINPLVVSFGEVDSGKFVNRTLTISSDLNKPVAFQFLIDCSQSVFKLDSVCGTVQAGTDLTVIIRFMPWHPINYYRRLICLVQNQEPIYIDLFGTCQTELSKPAVMQTKHLQRYQTHVNRGLSRFSSEQLNEMVNSGILEIDFEGALTIAKPDEIEDISTPPVSLTPWEEFFNDGSVGDMTLVVPHISLDVRQLDFGRCQDMRSAVQKTVNMTNHTKGKVTCIWMKGNDSSPFTVTPEETTILPLKTASFRVTFRPNAANQFFGAELECYTFYKNMRDYRLVEDSSFTPPWCLTLNTTGHTFIMGTETFIPRLEWDNKQMVFPAVTGDESAYRTLLINNVGENPVHFDFDEDPTETFVCKPSKGLLTEKYQLVVFRMSPSATETYKKTLECKLNDAEKYTKKLELIGSAEAPIVHLENEGMLYFKNTCVGTASTRSFQLKNISRIPLSFEWKIPAAEAGCLSVEPLSGIILPSESQSHSWSFSPSEESKYLIKAKLYVKRHIWYDNDDQESNENQRSLETRKFLLRAIGEGSLGEILCEECGIDMGNVVVGSSTMKTMTIYNNSNCSLQYRLVVDQNITGPYSDEEMTRDVLAFELENDQGLLPARTRKTILVTAFPARRVHYGFTVSYMLIATEGQRKGTITREKTPLCDINVEGVYPTLSITDARSHGSGKTYSKAWLWNLFSLDSLNMCLDADPSASELMYTTATRHSTRRRIPVFTRAIVDFNFGAAPVGSEPCTIHLNIENHGTVESEWAFLFPSDLQLELEYWAETGEYDMDELHEMHVMDSKLFTVEPKKGKLSPGQYRTVTLTYNHKYAGTNRLPILLKITNGREILVNFIGVTVDPETFYVHFPTTKHMFTPVTVGGTTTPVQVYELYNGGAKTVHYELDLEPLNQVQAQNYDCRILECLNPEGEIPPGGVAFIHWIFAPLEAKTYMVDIPIHVVGGETVLVTFTGIGYDQRIMGSTMPVSDQTNINIPEKQIVPVKTQLAQLSQERISFNNVPLFSMARRIVFMTNTSTDHHISFRWLLVNNPAENVANISPWTGFLKPGETTMLKVSFFSCDPPGLYNLDIICEIIDETEMTEYNQKLIEWSNFQEEKKYTFTITEQTLKAEKKEKGERPSSVPRLRSIDRLTKSINKSETDLKKYQALPPIGSRSADSRTRNSGRDSPLHPIPPEPFLLHLGVTARTHSIAEYNKAFPYDMQTCFIDTRFTNKQEGDDESGYKALETSTKGEMDVTSSVLTVILRGLLDDEGFHKAIDSIISEPVPYFRQICSQPLKGMSPRSSVSSESDTNFMEDTVDAEIAQATSATNQETEEPYQRDSPLEKLRVENEQQAVTRTHEILHASTPSNASILEHLSKPDLEPEETNALKHHIRIMPEFDFITEFVMENTLVNVLTEASREEINLTTRPRLIALPPNRKTSKKNSNL